jgi:tetratricopeptide (TPR) repeat protein
VLEGSVRSAGNKLRITAQLINVSDGFHLWSERYDRDAGDIFAIQDELSLSIVDHLKVTLHVGERDDLQKRPTEDHEAYNLYLKGLYFLARPRPDTLASALRFFQEALTRDPGFAKAHAGIATAFAMLGNFNFAPPTDAWPKAKAAVEKALALDDRLPAAHGIAASVAFWYEWDWVAAEASYNRILALNPGDAFTHGDHAWFLLNRRRDEEALREIGRAIDLDPLMPLFYGWSVGLHAAVGRSDEALKMFAKAVELDPSFGLPYFHAALAHVRLGNLDDALRTLEAGSRIAVHPGWGEGIRAVVAMRRGHADDAQRIVEEMIRARQHTNVSPVGIAWALAFLGRVDEAIAWLERGITEHDTLVGFLHIYTPWFAPALDRDTRYAAILERLGLARVPGATS